MKIGLVRRFGFTNIEASYLITHCRELVEDILAGKYSDADIVHIKQWTKAHVARGIV